MPASIIFRDKALMYITIFKLHLNCNTAGRCSSSLVLITDYMPQKE